MLDASLADRLLVDPPPLLGSPSVDRSRLGGAARTHLGVEVHLATASHPLAVDALTSGERDAWQRLGSTARRDDWLLGRAALRPLLPLDADTSELAFPHPRLSLTHAGGVAWAARIRPRRDHSCARGVGIDFEPRRRGPNPRAARFFLGPDELASGPRDADLLRLWTVKEALYKATADNAGLMLVNFRIDDVGAWFGMACGPRGERLRYASVDTADGHLALAVNLNMPVRAGGTVATAPTRAGAGAGARSHVAV